MAKKKSIEEVYNAIFAIRESLSDIVQQAQALDDIIASYGGVMAKTVHDQLVKYFIPQINKLTNDPNTAGAIVPLVTFLDSLPLALTREPVQPEALTPQASVVDSTKFDMPTKSEPAPSFTSQQAAINGQQPANQPVVAQPATTAKSATVAESVQNKSNILKEATKSVKLSANDSRLRKNGLAAMIPYTQYNVVREGKLVSSLGEALGRKRADEIVYSFNDKDEADDKAKYLNGTLTPTEKSYFGYNYKVVESTYPCTTKDTTVVEKDLDKVKSNPINK